MGLSTLGIKNAAPRERPYKLTDADLLHLLVMPNGAKYWRMNYRVRGKQKTLALGVWPEVGLAEAREKRDAVRKQLVGGLDPAEERKLAKIRAVFASGNTFRDVAEEWFVKNEREGRARRTLEKIRWLLDIAYPLIGSRAISAITAPEVLIVLRQLESTGRYESARRMRSVLSRVFRYAIATVRADRDVAADLRGALVVPKVRHRTAITTPKEVGLLMRSIDGYHGNLLTRIALRLSAHLFVRPGELRQAEWCEIDFDRSLWTIPAAKMKMGFAHKVHLSRQVLEMIAELKPLTGHRAYLFPSFHSARRPMSENTVNLALRRMGYTQDEMAAHGFRAMTATLLNESGQWHPDAIERQLAHAELNGVRRAYARAQYWDERVRMMQHWSDWLDVSRLS